MDEQEQYMYTTWYNEWRRQFFCRWFLGAPL